MAESARSLWNDMVPRIDAERCRRCADCPPLAACLAKAIRRDGVGSVPCADGDLCFACFSCVGACPHGAILAPKMR